MQAIATVERTDAVAWITMNQPERRNALVPEMRDTLIAAFERLQQDHDCRAILLSGSDRSFCAGGDLSSLPAGDTLASRQRMTQAHRLLRPITELPKPVIAVVDGAEACSLGLTDQLVTAGELRHSALDLAMRCAAAPPLSVALTKAALTRLPASLPTVMGLELDGQSPLFSRADFAEGRHAFLEKRRPQFQGR